MTRFALDRSVDEAEEFSNMGASKNMGSATDRFAGCVRSPISSSERRGQKAHTTSAVAPRVRPLLPLGC